VNISKRIKEHLKIEDLLKTRILSISREIVYLSKAICIKQNIEITTKFSVYTYMPNIFIDISQVPESYGRKIISNISIHI
jgi:hypothetical protein